jgi:hypothetical protein
MLIKYDYNAFKYDNYVTKYDNYVTKYDHHAVKYDHHAIKYDHYGEMQRMLMTTSDYQFRFPCAYSKDRSITTDSKQNVLTATCW